MTAPVPACLQSQPPLALQGKALFINGRFVNSSGSDTFETYDPSCGKVQCRLPNATVQDVDAACKAAEAAKKAWAALPGKTRGDYMRKVAELITADAKRMAAIESWDCGKALREATIDMGECANAFIFNATLADSLDGLRTHPIPADSEHYKVHVRYEPVGVVALITPWNYPLQMAAQKVAAALAAGCTCILKPSEYASMTCIELADIMHRAGVPAGVFNLVTGVGAVTGTPMTSHPLVRKVSFTGSIPTGKRIMHACADGLKQVHLELGGKSAMVVFDDANVDAVCDWAMTGIFWGSGQVCTATSRILAQKGIYEKLCAKLAEQVKLMKVGNPLADGTEMGPVVAPQQYERVTSYLKVAKEEGLNVLVGGGLERPAGLTEGYYVQPTIYRDVPLTSRLWKEEIFGPVLVMRPFETEEEAVFEANNTEYGLGAAVMTRDHERQVRVSAALEAGTVWENASQPVFQQQPFGGYKQSGIGRECGKEGFHEYLQVKAIFTGKPDHHEASFLKSNL